MTVRLTDTSKAEILKVESTKRKADDRQIAILTSIHEIIPIEEDIGIVLISGNKMEVEIL